MKIKLSKPLASNGKAEEFDVKQVKKALNRLGYYQPYEKTGVTGMPDAAMFAALKEFQKDQKLSATGTAKPGDDTEAALNREAAKTPPGSYVWRTVEDEKVRNSHAGFNRTVRQWDDSPDPGEEFNCRCWAEPLKNRCAELDIELQNAYSQRENDLRAMNEADQRAKNIRIQLDTSWEKLKKEIIEAGFDVGTALIPGLDGNIPILSPVIEAAKNAAEIWNAYEEYSNLLKDLKQAISDQEYFETEVRKREDEIKAIRDAMKKLGCPEKIIF